MKSIIYIILFLVVGGVVNAQGRLTTSAQASILEHKNREALVKVGEHPQRSRDVAAASDRNKSKSISQVISRRNRLNYGRIANEGTRLHTAIIDSADNRIAAFVTIDGNNASMQEFEHLGVKVLRQYGNMLMVTAPIDKLENIAKVCNVRQVSVSKGLRLHNDAQRSLANVDSVHVGVGLDMAYTGKGVVVGVVDVGIEYNHLAFKDSEGNSRVVAVYEPYRNSNFNFAGKTFNGKHYTTAEAISELTTDVARESHGTHTSSIAAGGKVGEYGGMAPEADIVLCGMSMNGLTEHNIISAVDYVFTYADSVGKPAVVNLSLGDHTGAHDGSSELCQALDVLADAGKVVVMSAGNEADYNVHFSTTFSTPGEMEKQRTVVLSDYDWGGDSYESELEIWAADSTQFKFKYVIIDVDGNIVAESPLQGVETSGQTFQFSTDATFKLRYSGKIVAYSALDENSGKYNVAINVDASIAGGSEGEYYLGITFYGPEGLRIDGWNIDGYTEFSNIGQDQFIDGDRDMSISSMATGNEVLSVGAYISKPAYVQLNGTKHEDTSYTLGAIAPYSSYGPDANGVSKPDVTGAGAIVVSAVNSYNVNFGAKVAKNTYSGKTYYWGAMEGTSMSAPQVTGIIALWLQANPNLDCERIREVLAATAIKDEFVNAGPAQKWGHGKIDAMAGLNYVIEKSGVDEVAKDVSVSILYPNPTDGDFKISFPGESELGVEVVNICGVKMISQQIFATNGLFEVNLRGMLNPGLYIVKAKGKRAEQAMQLMIR